MDTAPPRRQPIAAVGAVIWNAVGEVVLIRRGKPPREGAWSIPGGKVEWGERLTDALLREVLEETGLTVTIAGVIEIVDSLIRDDAGDVAHHHVLIDFTANYVAGELHAGDDAAEARWVPYDKIGDYEMWSETRRIIEVSARTRG